MRDLNRKNLRFEDRVNTDPAIATLRNERRKRELTQTDVGKLLGLTSCANVHAWEINKVSPSLENFRKWARVLGYEVVLTPLDILGERDARSK